MVKLICFSLYLSCCSYASISHTIAEYLSPHKTIHCSVYTYPMTLHFINRRAAASLRHRNRSAATVLVCEQKPYPVRFSWWRERYSVYCEHNLVPRSTEAKEKGDLNFQRDRVRCTTLR